MTKENLSQKLFVQKDGKKFAYAEDIREKIKNLKELIEIESWFPAISLKLIQLSSNKKIPYPYTRHINLVMKDVDKLREQLIEGIDKIFGKELVE